jgi:hypothetical protein
LKTTSEQAHKRAEAAFKKKEMRLLEAPKAMAEYNAKRFAVRERTARLRALRLARESRDSMATDTLLAPAQSSSAAKE